jgi:hypothetical protein
MSEAPLARWWWSALLACVVAGRALAATPDAPERVEVIRGEDEDEERPLDEEVRGIDARVADLRERIFGTKARLAALQELVTGEDAAVGARAVVRHRNEMGAGFVLESIAYAIDGSPVFSATNAAGELERKPELEVFAGRLEPGAHVLAVRLVYRVAGEEARRVKVDATHGFEVQPGKVTTVLAAGHEKKGARVEEQAGVRWRTESEAERAAPPSGSGGGRR